MSAANKSGNAVERSREGSPERAVSAANKSGNAVERSREGSPEMRAAERNGAAVIRALGQSPTAEYRARQLEVGETAVGVSTPYLQPKLDDGGVLSTDEIIRRGVFDAIGLRLRFSDQTLHARNEPDDLVARIVFDMSEQLRCESLVPDSLPGVKRNTQVAFEAWGRSEQLSSTAIGLLLFTVMHVVRSRLVAPINDDLIEDQIESTRFTLATQIGANVRAMSHTTENQEAFAAHALSLAATISGMVADSSETATEANTASASLFVPPEWANLEPDEGDVHVGGITAPNEHIDPTTLDTIGGYRVFTRAHDVERAGQDLYPTDRLRELRESLDEQVAAQSVSPFTLARRLQRLFIGAERDGWRSGEDEGVLDGARLGQVIANPMNHSVFRQERYRPVAPAVVSFLIDNSGSMKRQRHQTVTVLVDTLARALDLAGATSEVLGFTTNAWNGGEPLREWRRAGEPTNPGRLAEASHIIYKDADTPWKRSRLSVAAMMKTQHFREGIDGEAVVWAYRRLLSRPEPKKFLIVLSDGVPMEAATLNANGEGYLETHLRRVTQHIDRDRVVTLGAVTIDQSVDMIFNKSVQMDLSGTLTLGEYRLLETLFA